MIFFTYDNFAHAEFAHNMNTFDSDTESELAVCL